ncbi:MAG: hypothetical protein IJQ60_16825 [Prevotella sp.]|nr:hypothetical protein [Prevotella sp.]
MGSFFIITILCIVIYLLVCYEFFPAGSQQTQVSSDSSQDNDHSQVSDDDIMGKSTFDVNAELRKKRVREEEQRRKEAITKGEMTEDGKEIAQEVSVGDCEVETKREWKQVPAEELDAMFDETEVPVEGYADGNPINDIDLSLHIARKDNPDEEEERKASEVLYKFFDDTEVLDEIYNQAPNEGKKIRSLIDKYKKEMSEATMSQKKQPEARLEKKEKSQDDASPKRFTMAERYADFGIEEFV